MWRPAVHSIRRRYSDYLREQAAKYRELAEGAEDALVATGTHHFGRADRERAEVANEIDDRRASG